MCMSLILINSLRKSTCIIKLLCGSGTKSTKSIKLIIIAFFLYDNHQPKFYTTLQVRDESSPEDAQLEDALLQLINSQDNRSK